MKTAILTILLLVPAARVQADGGTHYQNAAKAAAAKDYATALNEFEAALKLEPDSMRFGSEYRMAVIAAKEHDRCIKFFESLVAANQKSANAFLNYGFAYVDKIPVAGTITQVILANTALSQFTRSIELSPSWIAQYTRGNSYLYWPKVFGRTPLGIADLEQAMKIQKQDKKRPYHVRAYISLGDGYWKMDDNARARALWQEGLQLFPESEPLKARLSRDGDGLKEYIENVLDPAKRVDTNLHELWMEQ
jgi:tetratricopeptide (TPR) repeat protein